MKQILKLVFLLVIGQTAFAQAPSNYTNINGRYRWIAGMFDSTFHIPKGSTPSLRTGGSTNSGGLFYNTSDSSVYTYTGTQWIKLRGSINPSDTTNKYVTQVYKKNASDSVFYVKGGNHLFAFIDSVGSPGGGGGGKVYYFNGGVSMGTFGGFTMYELGDTANTGAAANFTRSTTGNIANFITDPNKPGLLQIPAGVWSVDAWLSETGGGANHAEIWVEVEKWDGSTITTIATSPIEQITEGATPNLYSWSVSIPTTSLTVTDRIIIQFYISNTNGKTVTLYTQNGYVGEVHTTFTTGIGAINGLTAPAQYLVTGTSGTDFNINSSTATHTFNLPTASATNRGALSTTDWSTFNNKIGGSLVSGYLTKATGTNTIDTSQIYQSSGKIGIGRTNPTAKVDVYDSLGTGIKSTLRTQINTDVALDVKAVGNRGFALIIDQADSSASGTQYQTLFRKSMMPGTGNPANGGGVSWYTQIGNDNNVYRALSVYRARVIDSTGFANSNIQQTSTEFWTRKAGVWDTTLVLNGGNVGINTGQNGIDSALTVANGTWLKRGVRMSALPTGVGTKALRIDANGNVSTTDTTVTTGFVPYTGATTSLDMGLFNIYGQNIVSNNYATGAAMSSISRSDITASAYGVLQLKRGVWGTLQPNPLTAFDKNWYLPDTSGTLALASQLSGYVPTTRTITINGTSQDLSANRTYNVGTVTSVATNTGTGITGGTITTSGTIAADTLLLSTRAWRQKGIDSVAALANTKISGSGTTNYIPKFTSSSAIGNSNIQDNGSTVSITTGSTVLSLDRTGGATALLELKTGGTVRGYLGADVNTPFIFFNGSAAEQMRLTSGGELGLGTSSPNSNLTIQQASTSATLGIRHTASGNGYGWRFATTGTTTNDLIFSNEFNGSFTERMRLDASGNLGLGTSSPGEKLSVYGGNSSFTGATNNSVSIRLFNNAQTSSGFWIGQGWSSGTDNIAYLLNTANAGLVFATNNAERLRLDASGNLGLGVTPSAWASFTGLQVGETGSFASNDFGSGNIQTFIGNNVYYDAVGFKYIQAGSARMLRMTSDNFNWEIAGSGSANGAISFTQAMTLDASGNLAIGSTTALGKLQISTSSGTTIFRSVVALGGTANADNLSIKQDFLTGVAANYLWSNSNYMLGVGRNGGTMPTTEADAIALSSLVVNSSGRVGIGTTSPAVKLDVIEGGTPAAASAGTVARFVTAGGSGYDALIGIVGGTGGRSMIDLGDTGSSSIGRLGYDHTADFMFFQTNGSERMRITSGGELLINTTSDAGDYKLQVNGNVYSTGNMVLGNGSSVTSSSGFLLAQGNTNLILDAANGTVNIRTNSADKLVISNAGDATFSGSIKTAAPSGGTAKPWKLGEAGVSVGGANTTAVKVEIDGVVYYLLTAYLPEPAPESAPKPKPEG